MRSRLLLFFTAAIAAAAASACAPAPTSKSVVQDALAAMGGDKARAVQTITMKAGTGTRTRLQQTRHVTDAPVNRIQNLNIRIALNICRHNITFTLNRQT